MPTTFPSDVLSQADMAQLIDRLSGLDVQVPSSLSKERPTSDTVAQHLDGLLRRDPATFLQRHGRHLTVQELTLFECIRSDYEINYWLNMYGMRQTVSQPKPNVSQLRHSRHDGSKSEHAKVSNRRLAALEELKVSGDYFSMDSMRRRAPLLYFQMIGQYMGDVKPGNSDTGDDQQATLSGHESRGRYSQLLLEQHDEVMINLQAKREQEEEDEQMSEQESSDEDDLEGDTSERSRQTSHEQQSDVVARQMERTSLHGNSSPQPSDAAASNAAGAAEQSGHETHTHEHLASLLSGDDLAVKRRQFEQEMEERFLLGKDVGFDYHAVDNDVDGRLDDHWAQVINQDAQDAYFEDMDDDVDGHGQADTAVNGDTQVHGTLADDEYDY